MDAASIEFLPDTILLPWLEGVMSYHLTLQSRQDKLNADDHQDDTKEEERLVANQLTNKDAASYDKKVHQDAKGKSPETERAKEPQRSTQERCEKKDIEQIDEAARKTPGTELGDAVFTRMVAYLDLCHAEAAPVSHNRHKAMELAIEFEVGILDHFAAIRFEAIVDVVQVNAGQGADKAVKDARWKRS